MVLMVLRAPAVAAVVMVARAAMVVSLGSVGLALRAPALLFEISGPFVAATAASTAALATVVMVETAAPVGPALKLTPMAGLVVQVAMEAVLFLAPGARAAMGVLAVLVLHRAKVA
jgi:hypothetical protein